MSLHFYFYKNPPLSYGLHHKGFSLIEIMMVVAIIAILASIALPSYNSSVLKGRRSDAQSALLDLASKMESYFYTNKTYTVTLSDLGATASSPEGFYTLGIAAATTACPITSCYALSATAIGSQVDDGDLSIDSQGRKRPADKW